ncbi:hypothetical protein OG196_44085 (plasmid) [Kitasatospora purpeofusca]|uniref:hypothetical protein n=1 Tax=Kitasatospora purpeofusca TaxID=67352 RepID=UPI002E0FBBC9|nr:hypothetical protein OG196_44085 [Kitasatospora purpeofusca]
MSVRNTPDGTPQAVAMTTPDVRNAAGSACVACGHQAGQHDGGACGGPAGWTAWLHPTCSCTGLAFPVGTWAWPADGHAGCAGCDHPHSAHPDGGHCLVAAADEWDDCRCASYQAPQAAVVSPGGGR